MAAIDPDLSFSDQLKKIKFNELAKNSKNLSDSFAYASRISNNMMLQMVINLNTMKAQKSAVQAQMKADQVELRLKQQKLRLVNDQIRTLQSELRMAKAQAESIATRGRDLRGRFAGPDKLVNALNEVDKVRDAYRKLLPKKQLLPTQIEGLENSINSASTQIRGFKLNAVGSALQEFSQTAIAVADAMGGLVNAIYQVQQDLNVQMGTATQLYTSALKSSISSYFSLDKPILDPKDVLSAITAFKKEFGTILAPEEAERMAAEAKRLGVSADVYSKAKRAFLGTGSAETSRMTAMNEFTKQGLSAGSAIQFAAENANLVAIAGEKYAGSLFRAAAESQRIGVSLGDVEKFANSVVGDFESTLVNFAELSAMGVDLDLTKIAATAQFGTPEEMQNVLKEQLSLSGITGEELQRNRTLRLALTQTTGFDESTILRMSGVAQAPTERTVQEQQLDELSTIVEMLTKVSKVISVVTQLAIGVVAGAAVGGAIGGVPGALIGGTLGLLGSLGTAMKSATGYAQGGLVGGSGTSKRDSIPPKVSSGKIEPVSGRDELSLGIELAFLRRQLKQTKPIVPRFNLMKGLPVAPAQRIPILGSLIGGAIDAYEEYDESKKSGLGLVLSGSRGVARGIFSIGGGLAGTALGGLAGSVVGGPGIGTGVGSVAGGYAGSKAGNKIFDTFFPRKMHTTWPRKMKDGGLVTSENQPPKKPVRQILTTPTTTQLPDTTAGRIVHKLPAQPKTYIDTVMAAIGLPAVAITRQSIFQKRASHPITGAVYRAAFAAVDPDTAGMFDGTRGYAMSPRQPDNLSNLTQIFFPQGMGNIYNPTKTAINPMSGRKVRHTIPHELVHAFEDYKGKGTVIPRAMLMLPPNMRAGKYGQKNPAEALAVAGENAFDFIENEQLSRLKRNPAYEGLSVFSFAYDKLKARGVPDSVLRASVTNEPVRDLLGSILPRAQRKAYEDDRNKLLNSIGKLEEEQPGTGTILVRLLNSPVYKDTYLHDILIKNMGREPIVKKHSGGLVHGSGEVPAMLKGGEYVVNPKATSEYGTDFLNNLNTGAYAKPTRIIDNDVSVNNDALKGELRQIISTMRDMRIEMSGYDVGNVSANEARSPLRTL